VICLLPEVGDMPPEVSDIPPEEIGDIPLNADDMPSGVEVPQRVGDVLTDDLDAGIEEISTEILTGFY